MTGKSVVKPRIELPFYRTTVARSGGSRYIAITKALPSDWRFLNIKILKLEDKVCVLELTKLD